MFLPRMLSRFSLKIKIAAIVSSLFFVAIFLLARHFTDQLQNDMKKVLSGQQLSATEYVADSIGNAISIRSDSLRLVAGAIKPEWLATPKRLTQYLEERQSIYRLFPAGLFVASMDGIILADYPEIGGRAGRSIAQRDYFNNAIGTGNLALGKPFRAPTTQRLVLTWGVPIKDDQHRVVGVLGASALIAESDLFAEVSPRSSRGLGDIHVISPRDGIVVVSTNATLNLASTEEIGLQGMVEQYKGGWQGSALFDDGKGVKTLVSAKRVPQTEWVVISALPATVAFEPITGNIADVNRDALIAALLVAILSWLFLRQQLNPLTRSAHALKEISKGHAPLHPLPEAGGQEIRDMIGSFNQLQQQISEQGNRLRESEERWKFALEGAGDGVWDRNLQTGEVVYSKRYKEMYGFSEHELEDRSESWYARVHPDDIPQVRASRRAYAEGKTEVYANERRMQCKDGSWKWVLVRGMTIRSGLDGKPLRMIGTHTDITARHENEKSLRLAATVYESVEDGVMVTDADNRIISVNPAFTRITGYGLDEVVGKNPRLLSSGSNPPELYAELWRALADKGSWNGDLLNRRKSGEVYIQSLSIKQVGDDNGRLAQYVAVFSDITQQKLAEQRLHHQAQHDVLTDLPNRTLFTDRLQQALAKARRDKEHMALIFIDLDKFKPINDTLGHAVGDLVLQAVAKRMLECVRESDTVARVGGDEFVVLLSSIEAAEDAMVVAEKIRLAIALPFELSGHRLGISSSIGVAVYPEHGGDELTLSRNADAAMYRAKQSGRNNVQLFRPIAA